MGAEAATTLTQGVERLVHVRPDPMRVKLMTFRYSATLGGFDDNLFVDLTG